MRRIVLLLTLLLIISSNAIASDPVCYRGELGQSKILIAEPANYNKKTLILAHGLRTGAMPVTAEFNLREPFIKQLLDEGWLIASTSYRRNGFIIDEAIQDLLQLRDFSIEKYGRPERLYLAGTSMGGAIGARMAETCKGKFDGILCIGAALSLAPNLSGNPAIPLLFLSNRSEAEGPQAYSDRLQEKSVQPALWTVGRDGHCNVSDEEKLAACRALAAWAEKGEFALNRAITIAQTAAASVAVFKNGGASAPVEGIDPVYGNLNTRFVQADFEKLGIKQGDTFMLRFNGKGYKALLGIQYGDVAKGRLVAFFWHDGKLQIARNLMNAADLLGCKAGDMLSVVKMNSP
jgi:pimeloyl-ACP methyl ester carboxylesterase